MPNKTPNYNLTKPIAGEAYDVGVQNGNMDTIDEALKTHDDSLRKKVDAAPGKGLSTNDFTNEYKKKVDDNATGIDDLGRTKVNLVNGKVDPSQMPMNVVPIVTTAGNGTAYSATVDGVTDYVKGMLLIIVPHVVSTSATPTLNLNGLGAKTISRRTSATTGAGTAGYTSGWLIGGIPLLVQYDGTYFVAIGQAKGNAADLTGTTGVSNGGTGKTAWTAYQLIYPTGTTTLGQLAFPSVEGAFMRQGTSGAPYWSSPAEVLTAIGAAPDDHVSDLINVQAGVHGIRYFGGVLAFWNGSAWVEIETGGGGGVAPGNVTDISISPGNGQLKITWTDPADAAWTGTKLVRKAGSYPTSVKDGVIVLDSRTRNAYKSTPFVDSGLTNGTTYYYHLFPYSVNNDFNTDVTNRSTGVPAAYVTFGVRIDQGNSNPLSAVTYTDDAVGMAAGSSVWDAKSIFKDIRPCVLKNGIVQYYLNPNDFNKKIDGTPATINSESAGDVMIEIPKIGFKITTSGQYVDVKITDAADRTGEGFHYYAHTRASEGDRSKLYIGAYLGYQTSSKLCSLSGMTPTTDQTIGTFRGWAKARGNGYDLVSFFPLMLVQCLYLVKYKNLNSQAALGRGYVDGNSGKTTTGQTNTRGMCFGETGGKAQMKLFGIEDFWGNLRWWIDGLFCDGSRNILTAFQNFNDTGSGYSNRGNGGSANIGGWLSKVQGSTETGFVAREVSGSDTTFWADIAYLHAGYLPSFGGYWNDTGGAGAFYLYVSYSASSAYSSLGARLMYL